MKLNAWLADSLTRHYPSTPPKTRSRMTLDVARNERFHAQVGVRQSGAEFAQVTLEVSAPKGWKVRVRRVGYVPLPHFNTPVMPTDKDLEGRGCVPGLVPDPLFDENVIDMGSDETHAFWLTLVPPPSVKPGNVAIPITVQAGENRVKRLILTAHVASVKIPKRRDFPVTNWFYIDALMDRYETHPKEESFWRILKPYLKNLVEHGQDTVYTSVFSVQLDGERTPSQLLKVKTSGRHTWHFDWSDVKRFVDLARKQGIRYFEWSHFFSQWGSRFALNVYEGQGETGALLWPRETSATSIVYRKFLTRFLDEFHAFLKKERLLSRSFFHVSDEPREKDVPNYLAARELLAELAPWMKVMDAMGNVEVGRYTDVPVANISHACEFLDAGMQAWCYFCCQPRGAYLNRLMDTPLVKIRMSGWLFYRWPFKGFLHWGYNYWNRFQKNETIEPLFVSDGGNWPVWPFGDTFLVYPGPEGPIDSIRWEVFAASLQDYALLQASGVERSDRLLAACRSFENFPKTDTWLRKARHQLLFGKT